MDGFTGLGAGIWCAILTYIGWFVGTHEDRLKSTAYEAIAHDVLIRYVLPATVVLVVGYIIWHRRRRAGAE